MGVEFCRAGVCAERAQRKKDATSVTLNKGGLLCFTVAQVQSGKKSGRASVILHAITSTDTMASILIRKPLSTLLEEAGQVGVVELVLFWGDGEVGDSWVGLLGDEDLDEGWS